MLRILIIAALLAAYSGQAVAEFAVFFRDCNLRQNSGASRQPQSLSYIRRSTGRESLDMRQSEMRPLTWQQLLIRYGKSGSGQMKIHRQK